MRFTCGKRNSGASRPGAGMQAGIRIDGANVSVSYLPPFRSEELPELFLDDTLASSREAGAWSDLLVAV